MTDLPGLPKPDSTEIVDSLCNFCRVEIGKRTAAKKGNTIEVRPNKIESHFTVDVWEITEDGVEDKVSSFGTWDGKCICGEAA